MADFDWDKDFIAEPTADQAAPPTAAEAPAAFSWDADVQPVPEDPGTGQPKPAYADGSSPESALNVVPDKLTTADRLALALGDRTFSKDTGKVTYLQKLFPEGVNMAKDGTITVKDGGAWKVIDQTPASAWERTAQLYKGGMALAGAAVASRFVPGAGKAILERAQRDPQAREGIQDLAELVPTAGLIGATVGAGALSGGSLPAMMAAGAAAKGVQTVMGKAIGTYDAPPAEMAAEVTLEALMQAGGVVLEKGAKGAALLAKAAKNSKVGTYLATKADQAIIKPVAGALDAMGDYYVQSVAGLTGVSPQAVRDWVSLTGNSGIKRAWSFAVRMAKGKSDDAVQQAMATNHHNSILAVADEYAEAIKSMWKTEMNEIAKLVPKTAQFPANAAAKSLGDDLVTQGLAIVDDTGGITLRPFKELQRQAPEGASDLVALLGNNRGEYAKLKSLLGEISSLSKAANKTSTGPEGFKRSADFLLKINSRLRALAESTESAPLRQYLQNMQTALNRKVGHVAEKAGVLSSDAMAPVWTRFQALRAKHLAAEQAAPQLRQIAQAARGFGEETVIAGAAKKAAGAERILSRKVSGKEVDLLRGQIEEMAAYNPKLAKAVTDMDILGSARQLFPRVGKNGTVRAAGIAASAAAGTFVDPTTGISLAGATLLLSSPRYAIRALMAPARLSALGHQATTNGMIRLNNFVSDLSPAARKAFFGNPAAYAEVLKAAIDTGPSAEAQMQEYQSQAQSALSEGQ